MASQAPAKEISFEPDPTPIVHALFQGPTGKWQYIVADPISKHAAIIDPLLDSTVSSGRISTQSADEALQLARDENYTIDRILETHLPSDHASAAWYLRTQILDESGTAPRMNIEKSAAGVKRMFERKYGVERCQTWAYDFEGSYEDGQVLKVGRMKVTILQLGGPEAKARQFGFLIGQNIFAGDLDAAMDLPNKTKALRGDPANYTVYTSTVGQQQMLGMK